MEVALSAQIADGQPEDGQPVQLAEDVLFEGQQTGQGVQLSVETLAMAFAGVGLGHAILGGWLEAGTSHGGLDDGIQ